MLFTEEIGNIVDFHFTTSGNNGSEAIVVSSQTIEQLPSATFFEPNFIIEIFADTMKQKSGDTCCFSNTGGQKYDISN